MVKIKICGTTNLKDARQAIDAGADALGFIFFRKSPRFISVKAVQSIISELPPFVETVGVFVDESVDRVRRIADSCRLDVVQLHGDETPAYCRRIPRKVVKAIRVEDKNSLRQMDSYNVNGFLLDSYSEQQHGGTGKTFDWSLAKQAKKSGPVILAGGLNPDNVAEAVRRVRPYAVDVCSGVEKIPGIKDPVRLQAFIDAVRKA